MTSHDVLIIGAGPIGLELAVNLKTLGVDYVHVDKGQIASTVQWYPKQAKFFSSPDRIAIAGVPLNTPDQSKATREQYLTYLRGIAQQFDLTVRTFETVVDVERRDDERFTVITQRRGRTHRYDVGAVILAVGDMHRPRLLDLPGEDLPHVSHYFDEPHPYFNQDVMIVGGHNSAVEAAIRCAYAGCRVSMSYRRGDFSDRVIKYWLTPEIRWLIKKGDITFYPYTVPERITPEAIALRPSEMPDKTEVTLDVTRPTRTQTVSADFVLLLTGYVMDHTLFERVGLRLHGENRAPVLDPEKMEASEPGVYVIGTAAAGTQHRFKLFIENAHPHVVRVVRAITGQDPPHLNPLGWSRLHEHPEQPRTPLEV